MTALKNITARWGNHRRGLTADPARADEAGFTIVETTVAMAIVFVVLTGTLVTFSASVTNLVTGRQRTGAVALARAVIEDARSSPYDQLGHDLAGDVTLASDPKITGVPKQFEGEDLAGVPSPTFPAHTWAKTGDSGAFTVKAYVTWVDPGPAEPYKRLTVVVSWDAAQYKTEVIANHIRLSSFVFEAGVPPDPLVEGTADVDGGTVEVTGTLTGTDLRRAVIYNPSASGVVNSLFIRESSGQARTASGLLELNSGSPSGCAVSGTVTECNGVLANTATDSDNSTTLPEHDGEGPVVDVARSASAGTALTLQIGANGAAESKSTARSCFACFTSVMGDDDRLAFHTSKGTGPDSTSVGFDVGSVAGNLVKYSGSSKAGTTIDHDAVTTTQMVSSHGYLSMPAVDVVTVNGAPTGFLSAVHIGAVHVKVDAAAGPTAPAPTVSGAAINVDIYDTLGGGSLGYRTISVVPGQPAEETASATFAVGDNTVSLTTTVVSGGKSVSSTNDGGVITFAEASLTNWLRVSVRVVVTTSSRAVVADTVMEFDYGRLAARTNWAAA